MSSRFLEGGPINATNDGPHVSHYRHNEVALFMMEWEAGLMGHTPQEPHEQLEQSPLHLQVLQEQGVILI